MIGRSSIDLRRVFVDSAGYFAAASQRDAHHAEARETLRNVLAHRRRLFTTNFILAEVHALLLNRVNRSLAASVLFEIDNSAATTVVRASASDEARARAIIRQYQDKDFSLTDATSFVVMERLRISQVFTFDRNFSQYGLTVLPNTGHS